MIYTIKDSMFALILRFIDNKQEITFSNKAFLRKQIKIIRKYIEKYPEEERRKRAIEWIENHAKEYRKIWEKETVTKEYSKIKCRDCPISDTSKSDHCLIHNQWLELLQNYVSRNISSKKYIEKALDLLAEHKKDLKIKLSLLSEE